MGCLTADQKFEHCFGNIHLSGPCNRACYFCVGQHMMGLDSLDNLDQWPLDGIEDFVEACLAQDIGAGAVKVIKPTASSRGDSQMRWRLGLRTRERKERKVRIARGEWHRWFAWYPVYVPEPSFGPVWCWLEAVERRVEHVPSSFCSCWCYDKHSYRLAKRG